MPFFALLLLALDVPALPAPPLATPTPGGPARGRTTALVLDLRNDGVTPETARLVNDAVTVGIAKATSLDVISSEDMRRRLDVEATKQELGCDTSSDSCHLAELAGAMGADVVVYGSIGVLGDHVLVTLNAFSSTTSRAVGRETFETASYDALPRGVRATSARLAADITGVAVVVDDGDNTWLYAGAVAGGLGALAVVGGGAVSAFAYGTAVDTTPPSRGGPLPAARADALHVGQAGLAIAAAGVIAASAGVAVAFLE